MKVGTIHPYDHLYIDPILATKGLHSLRSYFCFKPSCHPLTSAPFRSYIQLSASKHLAVNFKLQTVNHVSKPQHGYPGVTTGTQNVENMYTNKGQVHPLRNLLPSTEFVINSYHLILLLVLSTDPYQEPSLVYHITIQSLLPSPLCPNPH